VEKDEKKAAAAEEKPQAETEKKEKKEKKADAAEKQAAADAALEKLQKELDDCRDQYQRVLAEYANYKRRTEQEKEQLGAFTKAEILKSLLTSLDNMERAIDAPAGEEYKTGVDMVMRQFRETLEKLGLEEIAADGQAFDPSLHNAVMREDADGAEADTVTAVLQKGYKLGERVLRPAMVKVAN
jgi:molecular chaperone GrpE